MQAKIKLDHIKAGAGQCQKCLSICPMEVHLSSTHYGKRARETASAENDDRGRALVIQDKYKHINRR